MLTRSENVFSGMFDDYYGMENKIYIRIKYFIKKSKISYRELGEAVGCSHDTVFAYANGKIAEGHRNIGLLKEMADYFGVETYYFCNEYHIFVDTTDVPEYLKKIRKEKNMSQKEFAENTGVSLSSYKKYETGAVQIPEKYYHVVTNRRKCLWKNIF